MTDHKPTPTKTKLLIMHFDLYVKMLKKIKRLKMEDSRVSEMSYINGLIEKDLNSK